jgi:tetratricopeptide (TPR) repeat protein
MEMIIEWIDKELVQAEHFIYNGQVNEGLELMHRMLYEEPGYGHLHNHVGWAYLYYTSDEASAELHLRLAIRFNDSYMAPYLHLGNLLIRVQRLDEALDILQQGLTRPGANTVAFLESIGKVYELKLDFRMAIRTYKRALAASVGMEHDNLVICLSRARKKRWELMFTF